MKFRNHDVSYIRKFIERNVYIENVNTIDHVSQSLFKWREAQLLIHRIKNRRHCIDDAQDTSYD